MRRLNVFLVAGIFASFLLHGIFGALTISGANTDAMKTAAWISVGFISAHVVVTSVLTARTLRSRRLSGAGYFKDNVMFFVRRISGFTILIPLVMHLFVFSSPGGGAYRLREFTAGRLVFQILFVLTLLIHIVSNIRPLMISIGIKGKKRAGIAADIMLVITVLLLLFAVAFVVYYLRWMAV